MSYSDPHTSNIMVYPEHEATRTSAKELAADLGISLSDLIWNAVDDYVTLHQHIPSGEIRTRIKGDDYTRAHTRARRSRGIKRFLCEYHISGTRECPNGAIWQFWDGNKHYPGTYRYACVTHLATMLDQDIEQNIVQRIEY